MHEATRWSVPAALHGSGSSTRRMNASFESEHFDNRTAPVATASQIAAANEFAEGRPVTTGNRKSAAPAAHPASNRFENESFRHLGRYMRGSMMTSHRPT